MEDIGLHYGEGVNSMNNFNLSHVVVKKGEEASLIISPSLSLSIKTSKQLILHRICTSV